MAPLPLITGVHQTIVEAIEGGSPFSLAVVLKSNGSVPREAGTKALVGCDGTIRGTIGGGLLEAEAQRIALEAQRTLQPSVFDFRFSGASAALGDPVCGGSMRVLIDPAPARNQRAYAEAAEAVRRRQRGVLLTTVSRRDAPTVTVDWIPDEAIPPASDGPAAAAMHAAMASGRAECFITAGTSTADTERLDAVEGLAEPVLPAARLLIAGGGHVGQALAEQASLVGFEVVVVEDREQFADPARYPPTATTRCGAFADALSEFPIDQDTYVAIVGRGHPVDMKALAACIDKPAAYIGMMGSRRKVALVRKAFLESGQATAEQFARIYAPIGLNLGAETVPEIAASIVAQLVAVRRRRSAPRFE